MSALSSNSFLAAESTDNHRESLLNMDPHILSLAEQLWSYHRLNHTLVPSDVLLVLCSHDELVAKRAAELFLSGWAPVLVFSGGQGAITRNLWTEPEAERFSRIAMAEGVPAESILLESRSTNTGENIRFTRDLLAAKGLAPQSFIVVQKPYMERRSYATFKKEWPDRDVVVTSPQVSFQDYLTNYSSRELTPHDVISIMVGDLQRIKLYPARGFQIEQEIPREVWRAFEELCTAGYDRHLVS